MEKNFYSLTKKLRVCGRFGQTFLFLWVVAAQFSPAFGQWARKQDAHKTRSEVTSVVYKDKFYTFIGFSNASLEVEPTSEVYDPVTNQWQLLSPMPAGKVVTHQGVAHIDNTVWHIGGRVGKHPGPLTSEVWIYNLDTDRWSPGPQIKDPSTDTPLLWGGGGAALLGRTLHVFGGFAVNACNNDQDKYHLTLDVDKWLADPANTRWQNKLKPLPMKRNHLSAVVLGGKIYALGGQYGHDCGGGSDQKIAHRYDPITDTWTRLTDFPSPRSHAEGSTFALDGKIYVVAGQGANNGNTNKVTVFTPGANGGLGAWADASSFQLPNSYEGMAAKVIGNTFIISHGGIGASTNTRKETYTASITRSPVNALGFAGACLNEAVPAGGKITSRNLLFTVTGQKGYTTSSSASWLKVTKNATGVAIESAVDMEVSIDATNLAPGDYTATVTATGTGSGPAYTAASFCVNLKVASGLITSIKTNSSRAYSPSTLGKGALTYTDRNYTVTSLPAYLNGAPFLQTSNDDKSSTSTSLLSFTLTKPAIVYVAYDPRATVLPAWLEGWQKTTDRLGVTDPGTSYLSLYRRSFPAGTVTLGGNLANPAKGALTNYVVAAVEEAPAQAPAPVQDVALHEAEQAKFSGAVVAKNHPGYSGTGFVDYINDHHDYIEWTVSQSQAGTYRLVFRYANRGPTTRPLRLELNGAVVNASLAFPVTATWSAWAEVAETVQLQAGTNKIRLTATGQSGGNFDYLRVEPVQDFTLHEAEQAKFSGAVVAKNHPGYSGTGFVDYINDHHDYIEWTVSQSQAGTYRLVFRYANMGPTSRPLRLELNGAVVNASLAFPVTATWSAWAEVAQTVQLQAGTNKIRLTATGQSGGNFDYLRVEPAGTSQTAALQVLEPEFRALLYPNPAVASFTIEADQPEANLIEVNIMDLSGRTVRSFAYAGNTGLNRHQESTAGLDNGVYLVRIQAGHKVAMQRLLIAR
jgi:uncharacterized protein YegP (UPF0339 family)